MVECLFEWESTVCCVADACVYKRYMLILNISLLNLNHHDINNWFIVIFVTGPFLLFLFFCWDLILY